MTSTFRFTVPAALAAMIAASPGLAQRMVTPEQRIERVERQMQQVQRRVFPQGQPADTAGYMYEPAATQASVSNLDNRIGALERQLASFLGQAEQNAFKVQQLEAEVVRLRALSNRLEALERSIAAPAQPAASPSFVPPSATVPVATRPAPVQSGAEPAAGEEDPGEEAYTIGFRLWRDGKFDQAISSLRAFTSAFPRHRRVSWANNLAGRAMLDKGEPRAAAEALLSNYRSNPKGERAADSLFYLGQSLFKLGQASQACKAYAELEAVYGAGMRDELKSLLPKAKSDARC